MVDKQTEKNLAEILGVLKEHLGGEYDVAQEVNL